MTGSDGDGGGIYSDSGTLTVLNTTVAGNSVPSGGAGGGVYVAGSDATSEITNSIVADSTGGNDCANEGVAALTSGGGNVYDDSSCPHGASGDQVAEADLVNGDGQASTRPTNLGGPTPTLAISSGSAARGNGIEASCPTEDQRGASWSAAGLSTCSAGAYDYGATPAYAIVSWTVSEAAGNALGTVTGSPSSGNCTTGGEDCTVQTGGSIVLTATPASGYEFVQWVNGDCAGQAATCTINPVSQDDNEEAQFAVGGDVITGSTGTATGATITASSTSPSASCSGASCTVPNGAEVTLTVAPNRSVQFTGWAAGGSCAGEGNPCQFEADGSETDTAQFEFGPPPTPSGTLAVYVEALTGSDGNPGTASKPAATLAGAMAIAAKSGDPLSQILMTAGSYPSYTFTSGNNFSIYGDLDPTNDWQPIQNDPNPTTIDGENAQDGLVFDGPRACSCSRCWWRPPRSRTIRAIPPTGSE